MRLRQRVAPRTPAGRLALVALAAVAAGLLIFRAVSTTSRRAEVERLVALLELTPDATVAEIGAGNGWLTVEIAKRLGPAGRMYSTELSARRRRDIERNVAEAGLGNVTVLEAAEHETNLPPGCCDAVFMRRVYHHLSDPDGINASIGQALVPGGRLVVIEFLPGGLVGTVTGMGIERERLTEQISSAGFVLVQADDWPGVGHYVAVFRKPEA